MMGTIFRALLVVAAAATPTTGFVPQSRSKPLVRTTAGGSCSRSTSASPTIVASSAAPVDAQAAAAPPAAAPTAERYVVQNRFRVKQGREAAFEKRWADRESRLGTLPGFRFFCMLRRVDDAGPPPVDDVNYVSCTVWETVSNFDAWRKGDAFKEAHGGGTVGGVASMLVATAMNTKGAPATPARGCDSYAS